MPFHLWSSGVKWPETITTDKFVKKISAGPDNPLFAKEILESICAPLRELAQDQFQSRLLVINLLSTDRTAASSSNYQTLFERILSPSEQIAFVQIENLVATLPPALRLPLIDFSMFALEKLSQEQKRAFIKDITDLISADRKTSVYEYAVRHIILRHLSSPATPSHVETDILKLTQSIALILSAVVHASSNGQDGASASNAFDRGRAKLPAYANRRMQLISADTISPEMLTGSIAHAETATPFIKKLILEVLAYAASTDGILESAELELMRAISAAFNCPVSTETDKTMPGKDRM